MKTYNYHTVRTVLKIEQKKHKNRGKIYTPHKYIHAHSLSQLNTGTSIKSGGIKIVFLSETDIYRDC